MPISKEGFNLADDNVRHVAHAEEKLRILLGLNSQMRRMVTNLLRIQKRSNCHEHMVSSSSVFQVGTLFTCTNAPCQSILQTRSLYNHLISATQWHTGIGASGASCAQAGPSRQPWKPQQPAKNFHCPCWLYIRYAFENDPSHPMSMTLIRRGHWLSVGPPMKQHFGFKPAAL